VAPCTKRRFLEPLEFGKAIDAFERNGPVFGDVVPPYNENALLTQAVIALLKGLFA